MRRRDFLKGILVAASAPAIVRAESLMKLYIPPEITFENPALTEVYLEQALGRMHRSPFTDVSCLTRKLGEKDFAFRKRIIASYRVSDNEAESFANQLLNCGNPTREPIHITVDRVYDPASVKLIVGGQEITSFTTLSFMEKK